MLPDCQSLPDLECCRWELDAKYYLTTTAECRACKCYWFYFFFFFFGQTWSFLLTLLNSYCGIPHCNLRKVCGFFIIVWLVLLCSTALQTTFLLSASRRQLWRMVTTTRKVKISALCHPHTHTLQWEEETDDLCNGSGGWGRGQVWMKYLFLKCLCLEVLRSFSHQSSTWSRYQLRYCVHFPLCYCGEKKCSISDNTEGSVWGEVGKCISQWHLLYFFMLCLRYFQNRALACREETQRRAVCLMPGLFFSSHFPGSIKRYSWSPQLCFTYIILLSGKSCF